MSQEKIECIIVNDDGVFIQEITFMRKTGYEPAVRIPSVEEVMKIANGCAKTLQVMADAKKKEEETKSLLDIMFTSSVEKYGRDNVTINEDGSLTVNDNGKDHKIWVESL